MHVMVCMKVPAHHPFCFLCLMTAVSQNAKLENVQQAWTISGDPMIDMFACML